MGTLKSLFLNYNKYLSSLSSKTYKILLTIALSTQFTLVFLYVYYSEYVLLKYMIICALIVWGIVFLGTILGRILWVTHHEIKTILMKLYIGDKLIAKSAVPEMIELGICFEKGKIYEVKNIRGTNVDVLNQYGFIDTFSIDEAFRGTNYLWDWFEKVRDIDIERDLIEKHIKKFVDCKAITMMDIECEELAAQLASLLNGER